MNKNLLRKLEQVAPVPDRIVNQYKRRDVFRCRHESHRHFNSAVSVYHVLREKQCYPDGCVWFNWRCKKLNKGDTCPRKYKHVGRDCTSCRQFYDEKVIKQPEILLSPDAYRQFQRDLERFERWVDEHADRQVEFSGKINSVKPRYQYEVGHRRPRIIFKGFLLNFLDGSINNRLVDDFMYMPISARAQARYRFGKGDALFCRGVFGLKEGSAVIGQCRGIDVLQRGEPCFWTESRAHVARQTGTLLPQQSEACHQCERGVLLSCEPPSGKKKGPRRRMFCLEGVGDPRWCGYAACKALSAREEERPQPACFSF